MDPWHAPDDLAADIADWLQAHPWAWVIAKGAGAAIFLHMAAHRLDLRIAGAVLIAPQDWLSVHGRLALCDAPLAFPAVLFPADPKGQVVSLRERHLAVSLNAVAGGVVPKRGHMASATVQDLVQARDKQLQAASLDEAAANSASDFRSSTAAMASRTSSMMRLRRWAESLLTSLRIICSPTPRRQKSGWTAKFKMCSRFLCSS